MSGAGADEEAVPLLPPSPTTPADGQRYIRLAIYTAIGVNVVLFLAKLEALLLSHSLSILASTLDSFLDIVSQVVVWYGHRISAKRFKGYPVGRARLSPVGILICATVMFAGAIQVIKMSVLTIDDALGDRPPEVTFNGWVIGTLVLATGLKIVLYLFSRYHPACARSPDVQTIADDHRNDVLSNLLALCCGYAASVHHDLWWADPAGAIVLAVYIAFSWYRTGRHTIQKLVGLQADTDLVHELSELIAKYEPYHVALDWLRCYHLGNNVVVEVEIVMPGHYTLRQTHAVAQRLQHEIERMSIVERAYVHVDYQHREHDEHKLSSTSFSSECVRWQCRSPTTSLPTITTSC